MIANIADRRIGPDANRRWLDLYGPAALARGKNGKPLGNDLCDRGLCEEHTIHGRLQWDVHDQLIVVATAATGHER